MSRLNLFLASLLSIACLPTLLAQSADLPSGPLQAKMRTACLECHDSEIILQQRLNNTAWTKEVDKMIKWGAVVDSTDRDAFIEYLSTNFPADKEPYVAPRAARKKRSKIVDPGPR